MKKLLISAAVGLLLTIGFAFGKNVHDWQDLESAQGHINAAIADMERAQAANHYDMGGHASNAEKRLREAKEEIAKAIGSRESQK
ncbi:MAG: hypothetical protein ABSD20_17220 [Terriglobales bacterium]|jgi:hypothetical protein